MIQYDTLGVVQAARLMREGKFTPLAYLQNVLDRIKRYDSIVQAFIALTDDQMEAAQLRAERATKAMRSGTTGDTLLGIPYGLKDLIDVRGLATTGQCRAFSTNYPLRDAFVVEKLSSSGAMLVGKLATDELACGGRPSDSQWPVPVNPWNRDYITGGSSSGSAVAVAAGLLPFSLGTDTGGSIRNPSSRCGLVGMKPTYGLVSQRGVMPLSWSQDHVGPMTKSVHDNAIVLQAIAGRDPLDATTNFGRVHDYTALLERGVHGITIGALRHPYMDDATADPEQVQGIESALNTLRKAGAKVVECHLEGIDQINAVARLLLGADGFANHAEGLQSHPEKYGVGARSRLLQGAWLSMADYVKLQRYRAAIVERIGRMLAGVDVLITASGYDSCPQLGDEEAFVKSYSQQLRMPFNLSGHPAMVVPTGISEKTGLPLSMQIVGRYFDEALMYQVAATYERLAPWSAPGPSFPFRGANSA